MRADQLDRDHLVSTVESPGYALIRDRQLAMLRQAQLQLETADLTLVPNLQGQIAALRRVMEVPGIIAKELAQKKKTHAD